MNLLTGKTAIITGASRGIGRGIAKTFVDHGCNVAFTYSSNKAAADSLTEELSGSGVQVKGYQSNAANFAQAHQLVEDVLSDFGSLDVLVNNAGITKDNLLMRMGEEDFDRVIEVNLKSVFNMTKAVQRVMLKQRKGSIINMSSVIGLKGNAGQSNYAASKAGVIGFTKSMAIELGSKVVKDTPSYSSYAIGISLPLQFGNNTFTQTYQTIDQVKSNIKNLLLTKRGERILQPEFGSGLQELLFEPNTSDFEGKIEDAINESIEQWLPYVVIDEINIEATDELKDNNRINVSLTFRVGENAQLNEVTFTAQG